MDRHQLKILAKPKIFIFNCTGTT